MILRFCRRRNLLTGSLLQLAFPVREVEPLATFFNANLRKVDDQLDTRDVLMGKHKTWKAFFDIDVRWIDDANLEVSYYQKSGPAYEKNNAVKVESKYGLKIHHRIKPGKF